MLDRLCILRHTTAHGGAAARRWGKKRAVSRTLSHEEARLNASASAARSVAKRIHLGSRVCVADAKTLTAALRRSDRPRPEPGQMAMAGRKATVIGYRREPGGGALYVLADAPGLWPDDWLDPI